MTEKTTIRAAINDAAHADMGTNYDGIEAIEITVTNAGSKWSSSLGLTLDAARDLARQITQLLGD